MNSPNTELPRKLGAWSAVSIVVGSVIGSGIFMKPATMADQTGSPVVLILVWVVAGIVSLFGGMINAEVGTMIPKTGGQYQYFRYMYGEFFAFLYGWAAFIVINTAAIAAIAFVFAQYTEQFITLPRFTPELERSVSIHLPGLGDLYLLENAGVKGLAILLILVITWINHYNIKAGGGLQVISTFLKLAALGLLVFFIFFSGKGSLHHLIQDSDQRPSGTMATLLGFVAACSGALASYDGWNNLGFMAGELKNPQRNIPRGLFYGIGICMLTYVLTNLAYLYILPIDEMRSSKLVASDALGLVLGAGGAGLIAAMVMISTLGAVNGNAFPCARISFAMAREGVFSEWVGKVHPRFQTPSNALWLHGVWSCLFVLTGSFDMLTDLFVFTTWIFYGFAAYGLFILRRKLPHAERPYKTWGYPLVPVIFLLFTGFYFVMTIYNDVANYISGRTEFINSLFGILLTAAGIPLYFYFRKKSLKKNSNDLM